MMHDTNHTFLTKTEANLLAGAGGALVIGLAIAFHKPVLGWMVVMLFTVGQQLGF